MRRRWHRPFRPDDNETNEKGTVTMKLTTTTHVSLDGVMQGLGGADEDRRGGFERGGWALPLFDNEAATFLDQVYQRADAFLFGRRTYEIFAGYWGVMDPSENAIAEALNTRPKYVASTTLTEDRKSTRLNSSHANISYAVFCLKKNKNHQKISSVLHSG